jgi:hypothetical protein
MLCRIYNNNGVQKYFMSLMVTVQEGVQGREVVAHGRELPE